MPGAPVGTPAPGGAWASAGGMGPLEVDTGAFRRAHQGRLVRHLAVTLPAGPVPLLGPGVRLRQDAMLAIALQGDAVAVEVEVSALLQLCGPCDRCLDDVVWTLPVAFREEWRLQRRPGGGAAEAEPGEDGDEDAEGVVRRVVGAPRVSLAAAFWQAAALECPSKLLCGDACRGLCPSCGANLNRSACTCRPAPDPRLAALEEWKPLRPG